VFLSCDTQKNTTDNITPEILRGTWARGTLSYGPYSVYEYYDINNDSIVHRKIDSGVTTVDQALFVSKAFKEDDGYYFNFKNYNYGIKVTIINEYTIEILGDNYINVKGGDKAPPSEVSNVVYYIDMENCENSRHMFSWINPSDADLYYVLR
jgi:maltose-binding protein MalE